MTNGVVEERGKRETILFGKKTPKKKKQPWKYSLHLRRRAPFL